MHMDLKNLNVLQGLFIFNSLLLVVSFSIPPFLGSHFPEKTRFNFLKYFFCYLNIDKEHAYVFVFYFRHYLLPSHWQDFVRVD